MLEGRGDLFENKIQIQVCELIGLIKLYEKNKSMKIRPIRVNPRSIKFCE